MARTTVGPDGTVTVDTEPTAKAAATWDGESVSGALVKAVDERRYTLSVAYPADRADVAVAQDGHRDFASKAAVQEAAWNFMRNGGKVGMMHADGTEGAGEKVESFIWPGDDWKTDGGYVVKQGDWMIGIVWEPEAWELIKAGKIGGVSMQGTAQRRKATREAIDKLRG